MLSATARREAKAEPTSRGATSSAHDTGGGFFQFSLVTGSTPHAELTVKERDLLSVAYKNLIGSLHAAWRIISSIEQKDESQKNDDHMALGRDYRSKGAIPQMRNSLC
ncbi:hypothetical protein RJ639_035470 [Escallonia herrerae]|uniref:14-3-3 domain-containing protein n=1 Tax=Escallonia herrerae TaxID=1293975 RepID=A0AA88WPN1_9ASTE|nr:hypothetical protein RJ639_035470 [Escallonia herrerae]